MEQAQPCARPGQMSGPVEYRDFGRRNRSRGIGLIRQTLGCISPAMFALTTAAAALIAVCPPPPTKRHHCVHDGDTIWWEGEKIRIAGIGAPELDADRDEVRRRAIASRDRLVQLLGAHRPKIERLGEDCYGRTLAFLQIDGQRIGELLIAEGHARRWTGQLVPDCR